MNQDLEKLINDVAWWIPFRRLRRLFRTVLLSIFNIEQNIKHINNKLNNIEYIKYRLDDIEYIKYRLDKEISKKIEPSHLNLFGIDFIFYHSTTKKGSSHTIKNDIESYNFENINFKDGDIVIDIGGHVGMVSIYLAKKYPFIKIYAFEPIKQNYECFMENIKLNNIKDGVITLENLAVTNDRRVINMVVPIYNTGQSNIYNKYNDNLLSKMEVNIKSIKLDDIFEKYNIEKCKLLKIDCEGAEYEILYSTNSNNLKKCDNLLGEFHGDIEEQKKLREHCSKYINNIEYVENYKEQIPKEYTDQTRPDQTRPDQTRPEIICKEYIQLYNNLKTKKLQPMLHSKNVA